MAWKGDSRRHSLARKGIKTNIDQDRRLDVSKFVARGNEEEKSEYYRDGFDAGEFSAMVNLNEDRDELMKAYENKEIGEIVGQVREHQVQMAGDISYDVMHDEDDEPTNTRWIKPSEFDEWQEGFTDGFRNKVRLDYLDNKLRGVYDNGGESVDRYSVIFKDGDLVGMSERPFHPQGFNQFSGNVDDWDLTTFDHLGKKLNIKDVPDVVLDAIEQRLGDE